MGWNAMNEQLALSTSLAMFLYAKSVAADLSKAQEVVIEAMALADLFPDSWVSQGIRVHANTWFLYEPGAAMDVLGGEDQFKKVIETDCIVRHFTCALGSICGGRYDRVLESVQAAARLVPNDPFVEAIELIALLETNSPDAESSVTRYLRKHQDHPLPGVLGVQRWK
jgi:hypothetical protein